MLLKRKQLVTLSLILMVIVAGYLQYNYKEVGTSASEEIRERVGEAVYVDNKEFKQKNQIPDRNNNEGKADKSINTAPTPSKQANDFFVQTKLNRESSRSHDIEELKTIVGNPNTAEEVKKSAYEKMMKILSKSEKEQEIETLIKEKGFENVAVFFSEDGSLDIVLKTHEITSVQATQIADVATRHGNINLNLVHIRNMY